MKCYVDDSLKDSFILRYEKINSSICIIYASGRKNWIFNNLENEQKVLSEMKMQVEAAKKNRLDEFSSDVNRINLIKRATGSMAFGMALALTLKIGEPTLLNLALLGTLCGATAVVHAKSFRKNKIVEDIEKNYLFLQNEEDINSLINSRTEDFIKEEDFPESLGKDTVNSSENLTLNDMDDYSYMDIKIITECTENKLKFLNRGASKSIDNSDK